MPKTIQKYNPETKILTTILGLELNVRNDYTYIANKHLLIYPKQENGSGSFYIYVKNLNSNIETKTMKIANEVILLSSPIISGDWIMGNTIVIGLQYNSEIYGFGIDTTTPLSSNIISQGLGNIYTEGSIYSDNSTSSAGVAEIIY